MRPLRFTIFLTNVTCLLAAAVYLWTPLIAPNLPNAKPAPPTLASNSVKYVEANPGVFRPWLFERRPARTVVPLACNPAV